jgi:hypothetical protein
MNKYKISTGKSYLCLFLVIILLPFLQSFLDSRLATPQEALGQLQGQNETAPTPNVVTNASTTFKTYNDTTLGIRIQYPSEWSVIEHVYNPAANNTIVGFFANTKTSSELGNLSGVSGAFVPYMDIYVFDSKNQPFDKIISGTIHKLSNNENFIVNESKPFTVKGNHPAHRLVYDTIVGGDEFFGKLQVYTMIGTKTYVISFTSQEALFSSYMPLVQKMISSFDVKSSS